MFRIDTDTAASALPTPGAVGTTGYFTGGNPMTGVRATVVSADWANGVTEELMNVLSEGSITPSKTDRTQVADAIRNIIYQEISIFNAQDYGAVADGTTDNYAAFDTLVDAVEDAGGGFVYFPPGTYHISGHRTLGNGLESPLYFENCDGLYVFGYGAKIDIEGNFNRGVNTTEAFSGIVFAHCNRVSVVGFEVDGNIDQMTKSGGVTEGTGRGHGIDFFSCEEITVEDCYLHHNHGDGLYFGVDVFPFISCRNATVKNVRAEYNARTGLAVIQLRGGVFINCRFNLTGQASYGGHSPVCGCDVEPDRTTATALPNTIDVNTGELFFLNCEFKDNAGGIFIAVYADRLDGVTLDTCVLDAGTGGSTIGGEISLGLSVVRSILKNSYVNIKNDIFYCGYEANSLSNVVVENNTIVGGGAAGTGQVLRSLYDIPCIVRGNRFIGNHTHTFGAQFIQISNTKMQFMNNYVFVPKEAYVDGGASDNCNIIAHTGYLFMNNRYETDLLAASGSGGAAHFATIYDSTSIAIYEKYKGQAVGAADTFRPGAGSTWNTTNLYGLNSPASDILAAIITNAMVSASAAIDGSKISPAFGSQNVSNTGTLTTVGVITGTTFAATGNSLTLDSDATGAQLCSVRSGANTTQMVITGNTAAGNGGEVYCYGSSHGSKPNHIDFACGGSFVGNIDTSSGNWEIGKNSSSTLRLNIVTATSATAGAQTLPANPQGFITVNINGTDRKIPYYAT